MPLSFRVSCSGACLRTLRGVDSACGRKSSKSRLSVLSRLSSSLSSTSVVCCTMRNKLGCRALRLKLVKASIDLSCAGVAPTLTADGGRVPWAGEFEPSDEKVRSPKPLSSSACGLSAWMFCCAGAVTAGDDFPVDFLALLLLVRARLEALDPGVRFLLDDSRTCSSSSAGNAPVIVSLASS